MKTLEFNVVPLSGTTYEAVVHVLTNFIINFPIPGAADVPSYRNTDVATPTAVQPAVVSVMVENAALAAALPLSATAANTLDTQLADYIEAQTSLGEDDLKGIALVCLVTRTNASGQSDMVERKQGVGEK